MPGAWTGVEGGWGGPRLFLDGLKVGCPLGWLWDLLLRSQLAVRGSGMKMHGMPFEKSKFCCEIDGSMCFYILCSSCSFKTASSNSEISLND